METKIHSIKIIANRECQSVEDKVNAYVSQINLKKGLEVCDIQYQSDLQYWSAMIMVCQEKKEFEDRFGRHEDIQD